MTELAITDVSREGSNVVVVTSDGTVRRSIAYIDTIVSIPPSGFKKIVNLYLDLTNGKVVVVYEP